MLPLSTLLSLLVIICTRRGSAQLQPMTPGPNETYTAGLNCTIAWSPDTSGLWTNVSIDLMSGSNNNMSLVTNVMNELDGTNSSLTPYEWICPDVDPNSAIYFYQFTNGDDVSTRAWTTRFTIASPENEIEAPDNAMQPDGESVPWGMGRLSDTKAARNSSTSRLSFSERPHSATGFHSRASSSASPTAYDRNRPHGHAPDDTDFVPQSNRDEDDDERDDRNGVRPAFDDSTEMPASRTRPAHTATLQSDSARPSGTPRIRGSSQNPDADGPGVSHSGEDGQSSPLPLNDAQAQPSFSGSSPAYTNSGAADAADSNKAAGGRANGVGSQLEVSNVIASVAPPVIIALAVLHL